MNIFQWYFYFTCIVIWIFVNSCEKLIPYIPLEKTISQSNLFCYLCHFLHFFAFFCIFCCILFVFFVVYLQYFAQLCWFAIIVFGILDVLFVAKCNGLLSKKRIKTDVKWELVLFSHNIAVIYVYSCICFAMKIVFLVLFLSFLALSLHDYT